MDLPEVLGEEEEVMAYTKEHLVQIWDDQTGDHIEVGPDRDGLELIEIRLYSGSDHKAYTITTFNREQAKLVAQALEHALALNPEK